MQAQNVTLAGRFGNCGLSPPCAIHAGSDLAKREKVLVEKLEVTAEGSIRLAVRRSERHRVGGYAEKA